MIDDADEDGSGSINFPEFVSLMMKKQEGSISKEEIKQVQVDHGQWDQMTRLLFIIWPFKTIKIYPIDQFFVKAG